MSVYPVNLLNSLISSKRNVCVCRGRVYVCIFTCILNVFYIYVICCSFTSLFQIQCLYIFFFSILYLLKSQGKTQIEVMRVDIPAMFPDLEVNNSVFIKLGISLWFCFALLQVCLHKIGAIYFILQFLRYFIKNVC